MLKNYWQTLKEKIDFAIEMGKLKPHMEAVYQSENQKSSDCAGH